MTKRRRLAHDIPKPSLRSTTGRFLTARGTGNAAAIGYMLIATWVWAIVPLAINLSGGTENPFFFNAGWRIGGSLISGLFLLVRYRDLIFSPSFPKLSPTFTKVIVPNAFSWSIFYGIIGKIDYGFLAISTQYISVRTAAVIFELWPLFLILFTSILFRDHGRYKNNLLSIIPLMTLSLIGFAFVTLSERPEADIINLRLSASTTTGIGLAGIAALLLGTHTAVIMKWGANLGKRLSREQNDIHSSESLDFFGMALAHCITLSFSIVPSLVAGSLHSESLTIALLALTIAGGALFTLVGDFLFRKANLITDNLGVNAISYAAPLFALLWLIPFTPWNWQGFDLVIIGAAAIIIANLLINFQTKIRLGLRTLIIALWAGGSLAYLHDDILSLLPFPG